jgi:hypothetical protein
MKLGAGVTPVTELLARGIVVGLGTDGCAGNADLILINLNQPHLTPLYHPFSHLVYAASGADVDTVFIAEQMVMRQRKLLTLDWEEIRERVVKISREIRMLSRGPAGVGARPAGLRPLCCSRGDPLAPIPPANLPVSKPSIRLPVSVFCHCKILRPILK